MATLEDFARKYASRLRAARGQGLVKAASVGAVPSDFVQEIDAVIRDLDSLTNSDGAPLTQEQLLRACRAIDRDLGVENDTFWTIKKGSVQRLIDFQRQVLLLFNSTSFR